MIKAETQKPVLSRSDEIFLQRVALALGGNTEPTTEQIADAMRSVCDRDVKLLNYIFRDERTYRLISRSLCDAVYEKAREAAHV